MIKFQKKILDNGLRVILAPMENTEAITLLVLVGVGSRHEIKKINGVSHFLEHLFFKGTKSRPRPGQIHQELDKIGAVHNAFTSKEFTGFWVKSAAKDFDIGLDIVSDILLEPLFKEEEIEKERNVILQEIAMYEDEPRRKVWDILENVLYGDQPIGWEIAGQKESVSGIARADIVGYKDKNYFAQNMMVVVAGNIEPKTVFPKIKKHFQKIKKGKKIITKKASVAQKLPRVKITEKALDQTHLALAARSYDMFDERKYALNLLNVILGGNASSKLFMEIREKLGLAYYVFAMNNQYTDCGYLGVGAGVAHRELGNVLKKVGALFTVFKKRNVSAKDMSNAKSFLRGQMALSMETSDEIANYCALRELFYKEIIQPEEILKKIEKVNQNDILKIAGDIFRPSKMSMVVIGAQDDSAKKEDFYKKLFSKI